MGLNSLNKPHFHFVCTNYGSNKDGIGHFTSKIVEELKKNDRFKVKVYSSVTHDLSKLKLFLSLRMALEILKLKKKLPEIPIKNYIILEYPFVEYNPFFLLILIFLKYQKKYNSKIVISLHEYNRTKQFRKLFIKILIPISDIVLFTRDEDVAPFINKKIFFKKRVIPANIEPKNRKAFQSTNFFNICFFGIINFDTKQINNMLFGWELYCKKDLINRINFHFISSSFNENIKSNKTLKYHFDLEDDEVSSLLHEMQFVILPLKPKISINNGSLSVGCIHECIPVGIFDNEYFDENFGIRMKNYSIEEFVKVYELINSLDYDDIKKKSNLAYEYGKQKSIINCLESYSTLAEL